MDIRSIAGRISTSHTSIERSESWSPQHSDEYVMKPWGNMRDQEPELVLPFHNHVIVKFRSLTSRPTYFLCEDLDGTHEPIGSMILKMFHGGHKIFSIGLRPGYSGRGLGRILYDFALTLGPLFSDSTQTAESRAAWYNMLRDGYDISLYDPSNFKSLDIPLYPDSSKREISTGSDQIQVYGDKNPYLLRCDPV